MSEEIMITIIWYYCYLSHHSKIITNILMIKIMMKLLQMIRAWTKYSFLLTVSPSLRNSSKFPVFISPRLSHSLSGIQNKFPVFIYPYLSCRLSVSAQIEISSVFISPHLSHRLTRNSSKFRHIVLADIMVKFRNPLACLPYGLKRRTIA